MFYKLSLYFCLILLFSATAVKAEEIPTLNYLNPEIRGIGDVSFSNPNIQSRNSLAFFQRELGKSDKDLILNLTRMSAIKPSIERQKLDGYHLLQVTHPEAFSKLKATYILDKDQTIGYILLDPIFLTQKLDGSFENDQFIQRVYQLQNYDNWLDDSLPPGYVFRVYQAQHTSFVELYGILETPRGMKALVLDAFIPKKIEKNLNKYMKKSVFSLVNTIEESFERNIP